MIHKKIHCASCPISGFCNYYNNVQPILNCPLLKVIDNKWKRDK